MLNSVQTNKQSLFNYIHKGSEHYLKDQLKFYIPKKNN